MLVFHADLWAENYSALDDLVSRMERGEEIHAGQAAVVLGNIRRLCSEAHFEALAARAGQVLGKIKRSPQSAGPKTPPEVALDNIRDLRDDLEGELSKVLLLLVEGRDRSYYDQPLVSAETAAKFSTAHEELLEAAKCFALGRFTASVMHGMRALEEPLNRMRRSVGLRRKNQPWGPTLRDIEYALGSAASPKTEPARKRRQALREAILEFRGFKDAWRNYAMHARRSYDREQAERILRHVAGFIDQLGPLVR